MGTTARYSWIAAFRNAYRLIGYNDSNRHELPRRQ
jgi:hypothetical protein